MSYFSTVNPLYFSLDQSPFSISEHAAANEFAPSWKQVFLDVDVIILQARIPEHASGSAFSAKVDGVTYSAPLIPVNNLDGLDYHTIAVPLLPHSGKTLYIQANITDNNATPTAQTFTSWPVEVMPVDDDCAKFYRKIVYSGSRLAMGHWFDGSLTKPMIRANARVTFAERADIRREEMRTPSGESFAMYGRSEIVRDFIMEFAPDWMIHKLSEVMALQNIEIDGLSVLQNSALRKQPSRESHENALFRSDMTIKDKVSTNTINPY